MRFSPGCNCCGCGTIKVTVQQCNASTFSITLTTGATVTVKDDTDAEIGSGTTPSTGIVEVDIPAAGDYTVVVSKSGFETVTVVVPATCTTNDVPVTLGMFVPILVGTPCVEGLRGVPVTLTHAASGRVYTALTGTLTGVSPNRNLTFYLPETGVFNYVIGPIPRHVTATGSFNFNASIFSGCTIGRQAYSLAVESGYSCMFHSGCGVYPSGLDYQDCSYPIANTLHLTDSQFGALTLTFSGSTWTGSKAVTIGSCGVGTPFAATANYTLTQSTNPAGYVLRVQFIYSGGSLTVDPSCTGTGDFCPPHVAYEGSFVTGTNSAYCTPATITITE